MSEQELPFGHKIIGFNSLEEIINYMARQEVESNAEALDYQQEIQRGTYVVRIMRDLVIWGYLMTEEEITDGYGTDPESLEELRYELEAMRDSFSRGYRYGKYFSEVEPDGEYGSAHVVTLWPITKADFEIAQRNGWLITEEQLAKIQGETIAVLESEGRTNPWKEEAP